MGDDGADGNDAGLSFAALAAAIDNAGMAVFVTDAELSAPDRVNLLYLSPRAEKLFGYTIGELRQATVWALLPKDEVPRIMEVLRHRLEGDDTPQLIESVFLHRDGRRIPIEIYTTPVTLRGRAANVTLIFDVSHRKRAEEALRSSEANFRSVIENAPDGIVISRWPMIAFANPAAARLLGFRSPEEALGVSLLTRMRPMEAELAGQRVKQRMRSEAIGSSAEYHSRDADGNDRTVEVSAIPIEYQGAPAILGFARDVTERKAMAAQLLEADKLAAVGTLAAGVAHEINNPLAYLLLNLEFLIRELPKLVGDGSRLEGMLKRLRETKHGAERVKTIVRDLQTFTRKHDSVYGPVDLDAAVEAALHMARHEIRHRAEIIKRVEPLPPVHGNATRFEQLFLNLLINAAHAVQELDPKRNVIEITLRRGPSETVIATVRDNGVGMTKEVLKRVFDPFFTTKQTGVGTGLGLPICHGIVGAAGGEITVESEPGVGTTVTVVLRARTGEARPVRLPTPAAFPAVRRGRVLLIDDERAVVESLAAALGKDHEVVTVGSAAAARSLLEGDDRFDVVLCDLVMPGETGMQLFEHVRASKPVLAARFVFMSGGAFLPEADKFLQAVDNPHIDKPFDVIAMRRLVDRMLEKG
ncbi:MAG: PAS domain S-box protein [Polyangiales bacterium]